MASKTQKAYTILYIIHVYIETDWASTSLVFEWSGLAIVIARPDHLKTGPFEYRSSKCSVFECFRFLKGRFSDPHCSYLGIL